MAETLKSGHVPELVTNIEVLYMLKEKIESRKASIAGDPDHEIHKRSTAAKQLLHRDWIEERVYGYLKSSPCGNLELHKMPQLVSRLKRTKKKEHDNTERGFGLTDGETLQILNSMPAVHAELYLIIEDVDSRLSEEDQTRLLELIDMHSTESSK